MYCTSCGAKADGGRFCSSCGAPRMEPEAVRPVESPGRPGPFPPSAGSGASSGSKKALLIAAAGVALVGVAVGAVLLLTRTEAEPYPQAVRDAFLQSCQLSGGQVSTCTCALEGFEADYSIEEYARIEAQLAVSEGPEDVPREVTDIIEGCT